MSKLNINSVVKTQIVGRLLFKQLLCERKAIWFGTSTSASQTSVTQTSLRNSKTGFHKLSSRQPSF